MTPTATEVRAERVRLKEQAKRILAELQRGPKSNTELSAISQRFGARVHELRKAGYVIRIESRDRVTGRCVYALEQEPATEPAEACA
jgi:hypothetical protein